MQEENRSAKSWLLLIHQIPPEPLYLRAKILRRIKQLGAISVKKSAYILPGGPDFLEDLQWLRKDIVAGGGEGWIVEGQFRGGATDAEIEAEFSAQRSADYQALAAECQEALAQPSLHPSKAGRLTKRLAEIEAIDFFKAAGKSEVERMLSELKRTPGAEASSSIGRPQVNATWVTRSGVGVDRMSSAWLIRRFIDPGARFRFDSEPAGPVAGEIRFDTFEGEYTHEEGLCTFEVLCRRFELAHAGLSAIGEIIHDLDLKDDKHQRPETPGVAAALAGIARMFHSDADRIHHAAAFFEILFAQFDAVPGASPVSKDL